MAIIFLGVFLVIPFRVSNFVLDSPGNNIFSELEKEFYHYTNGGIRAGLTRDSVVTENKQSSIESGKDKSKLYLNGSKTLGLSIGSRSGFEFDQSTALCLGGKLGGEVNIEGVLSDDNLPLQPEGTTEELRHLDEMYVKIKQKDRQVKLGDFSISRATKFGILNRELEGVSGQIGGLQGKSNLMASGAISKGKWLKKEFTGKLGKQGPYELSSEYTVAAGSEKVSVNGNYLLRGKEYTIDYSSAEIMFTNEIPIRDNDKIIISYQQREEEYKNSVYMVDESLNRGGVLQAVVFKEKDILGSHNNGEISNICMDSLYGWASGAELKGDGKGSYVKKDSIYEWVGYNRGNYEVNFTKTDSGDYEFDNFIGGYKFVGQGNGDYVAMVKIPLPQDKLLMDLSYTGRVRNLQFDLACGATQFNPNTLIGNGLPYSQTRSGKAMLGRVETKNELWNMGITTRAIDSSFYFPGLTDTLERVYGEVYSSVAPVTPAKLSATAKLMRTATDVKPQFGVGVSPSRMPSVQYNYIGGKTSSTNEFNVSYPFKWIEPFYRYRITESREERDETKGIGLRNSVFNLGSEERRIGEIRTSSKSIGISKRPVDLSYIYTQKIQGSEKYIVDLGNLKVNTRNVNIGYNLTSTEERIYREEYYGVKPGEGSFSRDSLTGMYYPDPHGGYEKKLVPCDNLVIHKNFQFMHSVNFSPSKNVDIRAGISKRGEGEEVMFWTRQERAFEDRNQMNWGLKVGIVDVSYIKEDYRENKIYETRVYGEQESWNTGASYRGVDVGYDIRKTESYRVFTSGAYNMVMPTWLERANAASVGKELIGGHLLYLKAGSEFRNIGVQGLGEYEFYGYSLEPSVNCDLNGKRFYLPLGQVSLRLRVIDWLVSKDVPVSVRAVYPPGFSYDWDLNLTFCSGEQRSYTIGYQGNKAPSYSVDHRLNASVQFNF